MCPICGSKTRLRLRHDTVLKNAPVSDNWKSLFENDLMDAYSVTPDHYEDLGDGSFQVFVKVDGKTVPYVTVNSRTGWYHG